MSFFHSLRKSLGSLRQRLASSRPRRGRHANVALERLDHRQLLSVTFTGNAKADIPDNSGPGFAIVTNANRVNIPDPVLRNLIKVSGFDINAIRMKYTPDDDILSIALEQPGNEKTIPEFPVIAGDADNNLNGGTVSPAVTAVQPLFQDFAYLADSETMAIFLDLNNDSIPDVVAGISNDLGVSKLYHVAEALVNPDPVIAANSAPAFGPPLQENTGFAFLQNADPTAGAFEFQILNFSQLYLSQTGQPLRTDSLIGVGGFAGSPDDFADELFIKAVPVNFGVVPTPECPPLSPPIMINPHQHRHVNTAHPGLVRVNIFGTSGFDVDNIVAESVRFGGAAPLFHFERRINRDEFKDVTFVFRGSDLDFPSGIVEASISGLYNDPSTQTQVTFDSAKIIFVRGGAQTAAAQATKAEKLDKVSNPISHVPAFISERARQIGVDLALDQVVAEHPTAHTLNRNKPTVTIPTRRNGNGANTRATRGPLQVLQRQGPVQKLSVLMNQTPRTATIASGGHTVQGDQTAHANTNHADPTNWKWIDIEAARIRNAADVHDMALNSLAS
jgi:hypothetical protein